MVLPQDSAGIIATRLDTFPSEIASQRIGLCESGKLLLRCLVHHAPGAVARALKLVVLQQIDPKRIYLFLGGGGQFVELLAKIVLVEVLLVAGACRQQFHSFQVAVVFQVARCGFIVRGKISGLPGSDFAIVLLTLLCHAHVLPSVIRSFCDARNGQTAG